MATEGALHAVNQRDLGIVLPTTIKKGIFFRASMQHTLPGGVNETVTVTVLDLRRYPATHFCFERRSNLLHAV